MTTVLKTNGCGQGKRKEKVSDIWSYSDNWPSDNSYADWISAKF